MIITLCSSTKFFDKLPSIKESLEGAGYEVLLPSLKDYHGMEETAFAKIHNNLIMEHFKKIDLSDAIYVANFEKNGIEGYIGGNTFLEMGHAFYKNVPIFLMNEVPRKISYLEELLALSPIVVGKDWAKIRQQIKGRPYLVHDSFMTDDF